MVVGDLEAETAVPVWSSAHSLPHHPCPESNARALSRHAAYSALRNHVPPGTFPLPGQRRGSIHGGPRPSLLRIAYSIHTLHVWVTRL